MSQEIKEQSKLEISHAKYGRGHAGVWQERFYEHTIRDEKDWLEKMEYIKYNPSKVGSSVFHTIESLLRLMGSNR